MQLHPSHHADDIGARLAEPSSLSVEISATGVPKYRIEGFDRLVHVGQSSRMCERNLSASCGGIFRRICQEL
jgi:hypothetical protein